MTTAPKRTLAFKVGTIKYIFDYLGEGMVMEAICQKKIMVQGVYRPEEAYKLVAYGSGEGYGAGEVFRGISFVCE